MFGSVFLSIFILIGFYRSNHQSHTLGNQISDIDPSELRNAETSFGSTLVSDLKGVLGALLSLASIAVNATEGIQTGIANYNGNSQAIYQGMAYGGSTY